MARVTVVGAGVVGLTCAVRLLEDGHRVDVLARDLPLETTSAVAAAIWYPYRAFPLDRVLAWSARSYDVFVGLADVAGRRCGAAGRGRGLRQAAGGPVVAAGRAAPRPRRAAARLRRRLDVPGAGRRDAGLPGVADLPGRRARRHRHPAQPARAARGRRRGRQRGGHRRAAAGRGPVGGPGARPGRVRRAGRPRAVVARLVRRPTYVVPRSHDIVVGGTDQEGDWSRTPSPSDRRGDPGARSRGWCPHWPGRACCGTGWACGRPGPRSASSAEATSCTATATAAPASP